MKKFLLGMLGIFSNLAIIAALIAIGATAVGLITHHWYCAAIVVVAPIFATFLFVVIRQIWWSITKTGDYATTKNKKEPQVS